MRLVVGLLCLLAVAGCSPKRASFGLNDRIAIVVVGRSGYEAFGSAFAIDPDHVVTAAHVVRNLSRGDSMTLVYGGDRFTAIFVGRSATIDLAVLLQPRGAVPPVLGSTFPYVGQKIIANGTTVYPEGPRVRQVSGEITMSCAKVAGFGLGLIASIVGVTPGFSGGPVFDGGGRLVGMLAALDYGGKPRDAFAPARLDSRPALESRAFLLSGETVRRSALALASGTEGEAAGDDCRPP